MADEATQAAARPAKDSTADVRRLVERGQQGDRGCARGALPAPFRSHLQLSAHERRQQARRRGSDDADVPQDAGVDQAVQVAVRAVLRVALPDRAQPRHGSLPREPALAARGRRARARRRERALGRGRCAAVDRATEHARADRRALDGAAAGADAQVRLQSPQRGRGDDPRQDRGCDQVASASGARLVAEADLPYRRSRSFGARGGNRRAAELRQVDAVPCAHGCAGDRRRRHGGHPGSPAHADRRRHPARARSRLRRSESSRCEARAQSCWGICGRWMRCSSSSTASPAPGFPPTTSRRCGSSC